MNDDNNTPVEQTPEPTDLPPQTSPQDTSNWDNRPFSSPDGREHIKDLSDSDSTTQSRPL